MKLAKVPKVGDIIKFNLGYTFTHGVDYPIQQSYGSGTTITISGSSNQTYVEVKKDTLAEVMQIGFHGPYDGMSDNVELSLILAIMVGTEPTFFKFNYSVHKGLIEVLKPSKALKLLYNR
jgi:hypothetical protein